MEAYYIKVKKAVATLKQWHPVIDEDVSLKIFNKINEIDWNPILKGFTHRIKAVDYKPLENFYAMATGAGCFFAACLASLSHYGYIHNIDEIFYFSTFYMLIDHYLDNISIEEAAKLETIKLMKKALQGEKISMAGQHPMLPILVHHYDKIIKKIPAAADILKESFHAELLTAKLQQNKYNLTRDAYLRMAEYKGGKTVEALAEIMEIATTTKDYYNLGACVQLRDDIADLFDDINLDIKTIAVYDYAVNGNLDDLVIYTIIKIGELPAIFNIFKIMLLIGLMHAVSTEDIISEKLEEYLEPYLIFPAYTSKRLITKKFYKKLQLALHK